MSHCEIGWTRCEECHMEAWGYRTANERCKAEEFCEDLSSALYYVCLGMCLDWFGLTLHGYVDGMTEDSERHMNLAYRRGPTAWFDRLPPGKNDRDYDADGDYVSATLGMWLIDQACPDRWRANPDRPRAPWEGK